MAVILKNEINKQVPLNGGHRMCPGCPVPVIVKQVLMSTDHPKIVANATGCLEVATTIYPYTSWNVPWIHNAFENAGATISGVVAAYEAMKRSGELPEKNKDAKFIAFGGDGGTYDIGLQSLSGALERGHNFLYVCYDNEGYMNTGIQRSSATPIGANTTTTPVGKKSWGKTQPRKDLLSIVAAHHIPYAASVAPHDYNDSMAKSKKAIEVNGPSFLVYFSPCIPGWKIASDVSFELSKIAVQTCFWPLVEIENGEWSLTGDSKRIAEGKKEKLPIEDFLKTQGRFKHLFKPKLQEDVLKIIQNDIDKSWNFYKKMAGYTD
ncbi:pyruvate ferredoxin oxidoreductase [bacterium]|nr:pyruvate ferredoxin oxidoreductase [bacterium]